MLYITLMCISCFIFCFTSKLLLLHAVYFRLRNDVRQKTNLKYLKQGISKRPWLCTWIGRSEINTWHNASEYFPKLSYYTLKIQ